MILANEQENKAVLSNVSAGTSFKITASAKAFVVLSSGLYSDKVRAVVRELSCNAYDSHVAAGKKDVPFNVHLPTQIEPWFSVRDFGTGMTKEQVLDLYSTYFESTKTQSNDFVGALGLGSKSPFSYVENFSVVSTKDGKTGYYTAYINEAGFPAITCMAEVPAVDSDGVEVKFPVAQKDFYAFQTAAARVFGPFEVKPNVNLSAFKPITQTFYRKDVVPGVDFTSTKGPSIALMGNIEYPIDLNMVSDRAKKLMTTVGVYMRFNIGELDFQASREHLSYIPMTVKAIESKVDQVLASLEKDIEAKLGGISNHWTLVKIIEENFLLPIYDQPLAAYISKHHPTLSIGTKYQRVQAFFRLTEKDLKDAGVFMEIYRLDPYLKTRWRRVEMSKTYQYWATNGGNNPAECYTDVKLNSSPIVIIEDSPNSAAKAKAHYANLTRDTHLYLIRRPTKDAVVDIGKIKDMFRDPPLIVKSSTLPALPKAVRTNNTAKVKIAVLRFKNHKVAETWDIANSAECGEGGDDFSKFDTAKTFFYLPVKGFEVISARNLNLTAKDFASYICSLRGVAIAGLSKAYGLYAVRKDDLPKVKAASNWVNAEDYLFDLINKIDSTPSLIEEMAYAVDMSRGDFDVNAAYRHAMESFKDKDHALAEVYKIYHRAQGSNAARAGVYGIAKEFGKDQLMAKISAATGLIRKRVLEILKRYPLISSVSFATIENSSHIVDYVNMVDSYQKGTK